MDSYHRPSHRDRSRYDDRYRRTDSGRNENKHRDRSNDRIDRRRRREDSRDRSPRFRDYGRNERDRDRNRDRDYDRQRDRDRRSHRRRSDSRSDDESTKRSFSRHDKKHHRSRSRDRSLSPRRDDLKSQNSGISEHKSKVSTEYSLEDRSGFNYISEQYNSASNNSSEQYEATPTTFFDYKPKDYKSDNDSTAMTFDDDSIPIDKERIHQEMQERLRQHLAKEGKVYPPPKQPEASHPVFANDGSFLETFKKMQQQQQHVTQSIGMPIVQNTITAIKPDKPIPTPVPMFGKRRGGKILKTGIVQKPKVIEEDSNGTSGSKDPWALYLQEVKKYKNSACDADTNTRPLVK